MISHLLEIELIPGSDVLSGKGHRNAGIGGELPQQPGVKSGAPRVEFKDVHAPTHPVETLQRRTSVKRCRHSKSDGMGREMPGRRERRSSRHASALRAGSAA